jgi:hypothetical protein
LARTGRIPVPDGRDVYSVGRLENSPAPEERNRRWTSRPYGTRQARVIRFAYRLDAQRQLTGPELASMADRLVRSTDPAETLKLREEIARGFYGGKPDAGSPPPQSPARSAQSSPKMRACSSRPNGAIRGSIRSPEREC